MTTIETAGVPGVDLVRAQPLLPISPEDARDAMRAYQEMCKAILTPDDGRNGGDLQRIGDKDHPKRSAMQKLSAAYGVSTEIVKEDIDYDDQGQIIRAKITARAIHPTGRHSEGDGTCTVTEKRFRKGDEKADHNIRATAVTRAKNRAISDLIAFGALTAEEVEATAGPALPTWARPVPDVAEVATVLTALFTRLGVENAGGATGKVGQAVFDACEDSIPVCVARAIDAIAAHLPAAETPAEAPPVDAQVVDTEAASSTHDTQEKEKAA